MGKDINGLSSSTLKWIAIISMIIDHFAIAIFAKSSYYTFELYRVFRTIGRIAFPIYVFLLVEGYIHTGNIKKYIGRCFIFAVISEIPFDLAMFGTMFNWRFQNVFFSLTLGLVTLYGISLIIQKINEPQFDIIIIVGVTTIGCLIAQYLEFDYHYFGIILIVFFYTCKYYHVDRRIMCFVGTLLCMYCEIYKLAIMLYKNGQWILLIISLLVFPISFIIIYAYNGQRGMKLKYFFYFIYPVHLFLFGLVRIFILHS